VTGFKITTATLDGTGVLLVSVEGELDIATAERLAVPTQVAVSTGRPMILDLSACLFIDSTGLRAVLHTNKVLEEAGETMVVVTDQEQVTNLFSLAAIDNSIRVFGDFNRAIALLDRADTKGTASVPVPAIGGPSTTSPDR
jgi:anti-anti-sigma factor